MQIAAIEIINIFIHYNFFTTDSLRFTTYSYSVVQRWGAIEITFIHKIINFYFLQHIH